MAHHGRMSEHGRLWQVMAGHVRSCQVMVGHVRSCQVMVGHGRSCQVSGGRGLAGPQDMQSHPELQTRVERYLQQLCTASPGSGAMVVLMQGTPAIPAQVILS